MADRSFVKLQCIGRGQIHLAFSWASGAAEDGTFPNSDGYVVPDGYVLDAYGAGLHGVSRIDKGQYEVLLNDVYIRCISAKAGVEVLDDTKDATAIVKAPTMDVITGTDGRKRSRFRVQVMVGGVRADLEYSDRVHLQVDLDNSSIPI